MRTLSILCIATSVGCLAGCRVDYTTPTAPARAVSPAEKNFDAVWQASRQTLRKYHFRLDRQDRRAGVLTTEPLTGMHFFEFWRKDAARPADYSESTLQTIYRTATVTIRPTAPKASTYAAKVDVVLRRSSKAAVHVTSTSEAYGLFRARGKERHATDADRQVERMAHCVELGHDRSLEAKLTRKIAAAARRLRGQ